MNWYKVLRDRGYNIGFLTESQVFAGQRGNVVLRPRDERDAQHCFALQDTLRLNGINADISPEPGSVADREWDKILEVLGFVPDDLPF